MPSKALPDLTHMCTQISSKVLADREVSDPDPEKLQGLTQCGHRLL